MILVSNSDSDAINRNETLHDWRSRGRNKTNSCLPKTLFAKLRIFFHAFKGILAWTGGTRYGCDSLTVLTRMEK